MATTTNITTTFAGKEVLPFISKSLLAANTVQQGLCAVHEGIKDKGIIPMLDFSTGGLIQAGDQCTYNPSNTLNKTQSTMTMIDAKVQLEFCYSPWQRDFDSLRQTPGASSPWSSDLATYVAGQIVNEVSAQWEHQIWKSGWSGTSGTTSYTLTGLDGFIKLLDTNANTIKVVGTTLTPANFFTEIGKVYSAAFDNTLDRQVIMFNQKTAKIMRQAAFTGQTGSVVGSMLNPVDFNYLGTPVKIANGIPDNAMVMCTPGPDKSSARLHLGTDLLSDTNKLMLVDKQTVDTTSNAIFAMYFKVGLAVPIPTEVVLYHA